MNALHLERKKYAVLKQKQQLNSKPKKKTCRKQNTRQNEDAKLNTMRLIIAVRLGCVVYVLLPFKKQKLPGSFCSRIYSISFFLLHR